MQYEETLNLEKFILAYLQRAGALTEQESYATLGVLFPEDLVQHFGEEQLLLAFDYEVAEETEGSLFVTHGSHSQLGFSALSSAKGQYAHRGGSCFLWV